MFKVTWPISDGARGRGTKYHLGCRRNSRTGYLGQGNLCFKKEGVVLTTKEWVPSGEISGHSGRYSHAGDSDLMCQFILWNQAFPFSLLDQAKMVEG